MKIAWAVLGALAAIVLALSAYYTYFVCKTNPPELMETAYVDYASGEKSKTIAERTEGFNRALAAYHILEQDYRPEFGSGKLYYNLANTYFQLEQFPWAELYYFRSLKLMPRDEKAVQNLNITLNKLQQPIPAPPTVWDNILLIGTLISLPEALQIFSILSILCFIFASLIIWTSHPIWKPLFILALCALFYISACLAYKRYFAPVEAVIVKATPIYRDAGTQFAQVQNEPLPAGIKVEVRNADGHWIKISLPQGAIGYVPIDSIRVI